MTDNWSEMFSPAGLPEAFFDELPTLSMGKSVFRSTVKGMNVIDNADIVIIGVPEDRNAEGNKGCALAPDKVREQFYKLKNRTPLVKIADAGNIIPGKTPNDTYVALSLFIAELLEKKQFPLIIGGSNDIAYANYLAYEKKEQIINIAAIDSRFDLGTPDAPINSQTYLNKIVMRSPNFLFNYTNIGYQSYFVDNEMMNLMSQLFFDTYRVGTIRSEIEEAEPLLRNADMLSVDIASVRHADAPGCELSSPNGFYGEEICRICRYAGMSDKISSAGFYEVNPLLDIHDQTVKLVAQMIWFFIEGYSLRKADNPRFDSEDYSKYHVFNKKIDSEIVFYKSKKTGRWWMEVPMPAHGSENLRRHYLVACSIKDYQAALENVLPDKWWQTYQKIM